MSKTKERILILDGHTNQALACVRSLGNAGYEVLVASHQRLPLSGWSRYCSETYFLNDQNVEAFRALREWATEKDVTLVLPLTERSCLLCNKERTEWESAGIVVGCGPDDMLKNAFDKSLTLRLAKAAGVRIPPTYFPDSLNASLQAVEEIGFPCVIKPRWSNAWDGKEFLPPKNPTYLNGPERSSEVLNEYKQGQHWPLIQGFVSGCGKGVFALCNRGEVVAWFAHERLRDTRPTGSSSSLRRSIRLEPRLREPAENLLRKLNWHGPAMVEFKDDGVNDPCLMEINGRFWGSLQLAIDAGVDFPKLWVSILKGENVAPVTSYTEGLTLRWMWGDIKRLFFIMRGAPAGYPGPFPGLGQGLRELLGKQPAGTVKEIWRRDDWWPGVGEVTGGLRALLTLHTTKKPERNGFATHKSNGSNGPASAHLAFAPKHANGTKGLTIREANLIELLKWDEMVMKFDNYRVCHKRAWIHSLKASIKGQPLFLVYEKGGEVVGCLPGFLTNIGPLRMFGSPLQGWQTVGMGPVFDQTKTSTEELVTVLIPFLEKSYGVHHVEMISNTLETAPLMNMQFRNEELPTYRAPLYPGDESRTMRGMKESARRNVKRGIKLGLEVRFEDDESFVDEHYDQLREVFARGGNMVPFGKKRALEFFRHMKSAGNLIAVSVYLPNDGPNIATGMFTVEGKELLLWMWTHRTQYRWYRPTELMTWTVMKKAMEMGCETFDFMGRGDFKAKFGAELDCSKQRWTWSRYQWLAATRTVASRGYKWQQSVRGRMIRRSMFGGSTVAENDAPPIVVNGPVLKGVA